LSYKKGEGDRVRKSLLKLLGVVVALMLSTTVSAIGMGGINVTSALGQPLKADIELVAISKSEKDSLSARLASPESYKSAGLEYPYGNVFKFQIETRPDGQTYIKARSAQPVNDPFVSLLVELTWSAGKLSREYTFLLDPPGYVAEQPAKTQVQAVAPEVESAGTAAVGSATPAAPEGSAVTSPLQAAPVVTVAPVEQPAAAKAAAESEEQTTPMETGATPEEQAVPAEIGEEQAALPVPAAPKEWIEVQRGDTMYKIAARYKLADMNLDRMLVAMYRANADKFDGRNMNRIRAGKILQLPSQQQLASVSLADAMREIHAQASDWNAYRQKLASAVPVSNQPQDAQQVATGKISSSIADMAPVAKESAKEVLKLSKGEAPGDLVGTGAGSKGMSEQDRKNAALEDAIAKNKALKEAQERTAMLEKNLQDMQRLAQLKAEAAALAKAPAAAPTPTPAPAPAAAKSAVSVTTSIAKPPPVVQPKPKPKQAKNEPSLMDQVLAEPLYLAAGAAVLLLLGGIGYMLNRRRKKNFWIEVGGQSPEDIGEIAGHMAAPVTPSPDTGDFTQSQTAASAQIDNVDPISEADLFLNFGRDVQAEEILKEALQSNPNNHQIHLKLLGIYAARKDADSFSTIARQLQGSGDDAAWQQAVAMGRKLEPNNPMYGGSSRSMEDTGSATVQVPVFNMTPEPENAPKAQASALDFDFDMGASEPEDTHSPERELLAAAQKTSILTAEGDLVAQHPEMDFDVTSESPKISPEEAAAPFKPADDGGMPFTLDFPAEKETSEKPVAAAAMPDIGFAGISLNFDDVPAPAPGAPEAENKGDQWQEVATKLDLANAYREMGDASGAREILEEVLREGDAEQREAAQNLIVLLG
jgi:pilus assembly protein FimV